MKMSFLKTHNLRDHGTLLYCDLVKADIETFCGLAEKGLYGLKNFRF
jgi:hypothetical protein